MAETRKCVGGWRDPNTPSLQGTLVRVLDDGTFEAFGGHAGWITIAPPINARADLLAAAQDALETGELPDAVYAALEAAIAKARGEDG